MNLKSILVVLCTAFTSFLIAQIQLETDGEKQILGPKAGDTRIGLNFNSIDYFGGSYKDAIGLEVEHFFKDKWALSANFQGHALNRETENYKSSNWGIGLDLSVKYYFLKKKKWNFWADAKIGYSYFNLKSENLTTNTVNQDNPNAMRAALGLGVEYKTSDHFSVFMSTDLIGRSTMWEGNESLNSFSVPHAVTFGVKLKL